MRLCRNRKFMSFCHPERSEGFREHPCIIGILLPCGRLNNKMIGDFNFDTSS